MKTYVPVIKMSGREKVLLIKTSIFVCAHRETTSWPALFSTHTEQT